MENVNNLNLGSGDWGEVVPQSHCYVAWWPHESTIGHMLQCLSLYVF